MDQNNTPLKPVKKSREFSLSAIWVVSTFIFCVIFAIILAPRAKAQSRQSVAGQYTSMFRYVFDIIQERYVEEVDPKVLFEGAMTGMFNSLDDPYSAFHTEAEMEDLNDLTQGNFGGVGLYITKYASARPDGKANFLEVAAPIEDTPGWRAGINTGDFIIQINGESTEPLTTDEAMVRLRGEPGTKVELVIRRGEKVEFPVTLTRAVIEVPTVKHAMIGDMGYLKLITFTPFTADRSRDAIQDFSAKGYKGLILDLRNNPGGLLDSAVGVSNLFFENALVVSTKYRDGREGQELYARRKAVVPGNVPVIVLINRGSASASEIVAGALKDHSRAYLVGEKSYGKGSVQEVLPLNRAGFRLTTARYYTPSDVNIDKIGIPPDREVPLPEFTEADAENLNTLINSGKIAEFIKGKPNAARGEIEAFARELNKEFSIDISLLTLLVRNEQNRSAAVAPVYDLEYDVQLQEAVKILREEDFGALMRTTKTLKALQEEAVQDDEIPLAS